MWRRHNRICAPSPLQTFQANEDATEVVLNKIHSPVLTRFVRIRPQSWHNGIALRLELYGCRITGEGPFLSSASALLSVPPAACPGMPPGMPSPQLSWLLGVGTVSLRGTHPKACTWETGTQSLEAKKKCLNLRGNPQALPCNCPDCSCPFLSCRFTLLQLAGNALWPHP